MINYGPLPKRVPIAGVWFRVKRAKLPKDVDGDTQVFRRLIRVDHKLRGAEAWQVLWHECLHAVLGRAGFRELLGDKQEEAVVTAVEYHTWDLLQWLDKRGKSVSKPRRSRGSKH